MRSDDDPIIDHHEFRRALGCFATGVAVVTALDARGEKVGITISSFNSVSMNPPLVLWSIANSANTFDTFINAEYFAVNVLTIDQHELSSRFASKDIDKFAGLDCREGLHGAPILPEYAACFECRTEHRYDGGDHTIIVGRVLRLDDRDEDPLIFYRGHFHNKGAPKSGDS
ncbi:MAG: flavin reductase family protein [Gammaproteobacteria bacterium]|nr:flavin reductase family protein [Gammaproteobacteria bacterium]MDH5618667.1 flavin reductase family protein [Gammaproteobacteria bacterium]